MGRSTGSRGVTRPPRHEEGRGRRSSSRRTGRTSTRSRRDRRVPSPCNVADVRLRHADRFSDGHLGDTREGDRGGYTFGWRRRAKNGQLSLGEHPGDNDTRGTTTSRMVGDLRRGPRLAGGTGLAGQAELHEALRCPGSRRHCRRRRTACRGGDLQQAWASGDNEPVLPGHLAPFGHSGFSKGSPLHPATGRARASAGAPS